MTAPADLAPFTPADTGKRNFSTYVWRGWLIDVWADYPLCVLWHNARFWIMETGDPAELVARALELEAAS